MIKIFFDGAYALSTGTMGLAFVIEVDNKTVKEFSDKITCEDKFILGDKIIQLKGIDDVSNNVSEYLSVIRGLEWVSENYPDYGKTIKVIGDSKLVIEQMNGTWSIKAGVYAPYAKYAMQFIWKNLKRVTFQWVPRSENTRCDALSRKLI